MVGAEGTDGIVNKGNTEETYRFERRAETFPASSQGRNHGRVRGRHCPRWASTTTSTPDHPLQSLENLELVILLSIFHSVLPSLSARAHRLFLFATWFECTAPKPTSPRVARIDPSPGSVLFRFAVPFSVHNHPITAFDRDAATTARSLTMPFN